MTAPTPKPKPTCPNPDWSAKPDADTLQTYYPDRAQRMNMSGTARVSCTVQPNGTLTACSVVSEDPPDYGFGTAAIKMAHYFKMKTRDVDCLGATIVVPIRFNAPTE